VWNLIGLMIYVMTVTATPEGYAAQGYTAEQIAFIQATPTWATAAFAISVNAGVLGSLFLLLRKAWAAPTFVLSLIAILILNVNNFVLNDTVAVLGTVPVIIQSAIVLIAVLLVWYSRAMRDKDWLT
jgi:hypothetical protein